MARELTDDQRVVFDEATRLLAERSSSEAVRRVVESGAGWDAELWSTVARELGWCAVSVPTEHGGLGYGAAELSLLMEAVGYRLAPLPLWSTVCMAAPMLAALATVPAKAELLGRIAEGSITATVAWGDLSLIDPLPGTQVTARREQGGYVLAGTVSQVTNLEAADLILVPARLEGGFALFALERDAGFGTRRLEALDATRQIGELSLRTLRVPDTARIDSAGITSENIAPPLALANLGLAAEQAGSARGAMDITLAYIAGRVQFGRTIASFQAVKHRCALLEVELAEAQALVHGAAANLDSGYSGIASLEIAGARALASSVLFHASEEAIQLHGGAGFTWEYDPQLYFKRAQATAPLLGAPHLQLERVADALLDHGDGG